MEHRLLDSGFTLEEVYKMGTKEVSARFAVLSYMDQKKMEAEQEQWSQVTRMR